MNKKIVMWVLVGLVIICGGYFVFKNYNNLAVIQNGVNKNKQTGQALNVGEPCEYTTDDGYGNITTHKGVGQMYYPPGNGFPYVYCGATSGGSGILLKFDENTNGFDANINSIYFADKKSEKNFLDWASKNAGVCLGVMEEARNNPYLQDSKNIGKFFSDSILLKNNIKPYWNGASDSCYIDQPVEGPTSDIPTVQ